MAYCVNRDCPAQIFEGLNHFVSRGAMDISGLGPSTIQKMMDLGFVKSSADLYALTEDQVAELPGFKDKSIKNLLKALEASKQRRFENVLLALGIRHVGEGVAALLIERFNDIDSLMNAGEEEIAGVLGIGPQIALSVHQYFQDQRNRELVERLRNAGLKMKGEPRIVKEGPLTGKTFIITGTLESMPRSAAEKWIAELGGSIASSVSKKLDYLVVGADPGSKLAKARKLGIQEITEKQLMEMKENNES
jgi:DNA ligase (NAD+)